MNAMILYNELNLAKLAHARLIHSADQADTAMLWRVSPCRLDLLQNPLIAAMTMADAIRANLLVFAVRHQLELPPELLRWLEVWARLRESQEVALALFDTDHQDRLAPCVAPALNRFAQEHGLSFIFGDTPSAATAPETESAYQPFSF